MTRTYQDWEHDARNTTKSVYRLGNELRDRWDDWKDDAPYASWGECLRDQLGITTDALRSHNKRDRNKANVRVSSDTVTEPSPPLRQVYSYGTPEEISRRRAHTAVLWQEGWTRGPISRVLGVNEGTTQRDLLASGCEGKRSRTKSQGKPEGDFRWRNQDIPDDGDQSTIEQPSFVACKTPSAAEAIEDIRVQLSLTLGGALSPVAEGPKQPHHHPHQRFRKVT